MKYDPIEIKKEGKNLEFYFVRVGGNHWFYEVHSFNNEKDIQNWDEHLKEKMWYTPVIRAKVLKDMREIVDKE